MMAGKGCLRLNAAHDLVKEAANLNQKHVLLLLTCQQ
jgi:hypothetical protein